LSAFTAALAAYGVLVATYKCGLRSERYPPADLISSLQTAFDVLGKLGGDTRQVVRCQKIVRHLIQAAWTLYPEARASESAQRPLTIVTTSKPEQMVEDVSAGAGQPPFDFMGAFDPDFDIDSLDLSTFPDDLSSLFPDGF
jgi:hypothetical protein